MVLLSSALRGPLRGKRLVDDPDEAPRGAMAPKRRAWARLERRGGRRTRGSRAEIKTSRTCGNTSDERLLRNTQTIIHGAAARMWRAGTPIQNSFFPFSASQLHRPSLNVGISCGALPRRSPGGGGDLVSASMAPLISEQLRNVRARTAQDGAEAR